MKQAKISRLLIVAIILGIGFAVAWGFGLGAVGSFVSSLLGPHTQGDYEEIMVDRSGEPFIQVRIAGNYENMEYRTLNGKLADDDSAKYSAPSRLDGPYRTPRLFNLPITWRERLIGLSGTEKPPVSWLLMRNAERPGRAYLVGYQPASNQRVGFIGRRGLRSSLPPNDEQFDVGEQVFGYGSDLFATTASVNVGGLGYNYTSVASKRPGQFEPWQLFIRDGNTVREINLKSREVRVVQEFGQLLGIGMLDFTPLDAPEIDDHWPEKRLAVRTQQQLVVYNTFDNSEVEFMIPKELRNETFSVNTVGANELLLHVHRGHWERGNIAELLRINTAGEIQEKQTVKLLTYSSNTTSPAESLIPAVLAPALIVWCLGIFVVAPLSMMQNYDVTNFADGITMAWEHAWLGLLVVLAVSMILAAIVYRWQKKYSREQTVFWTLFVFLTTLPGFFAYWVMHRREPVAACPHCRTDVPRDRDTCAKCAAPFPAPKLLGTEIYA